MPPATAALPHAPPRALPHFWYRSRCAEDDDDSNETNDSCTSSHHVLVHSLPLAAPAWQLVGGGDATSAAVPLATAPTALQLGLDAAGQPLLLLAREGGAAVVLERSGGGWAQLGGRATSQHDTVDAAMAVVDGAPLVVFGGTQGVQCWWDGGFLKLATQPSPASRAAATPGQQPLQAAHTLAVVRSVPLPTHSPPAADAENEQREGNRLSARRWGPASSSRGGGGGGGSSANKWAAVGEDYWSLAQLETNRLTPALAAGPDSPAYVAFSFYRATYQQVAAMQWDAAAGTWVDAGEPFGMGTCWGVRLALRPESGLPVAAFLSTPSSRNPPLAAVYVYSPPGRWAALGAPQGFRPATALDLSVDPSTGRGGGRDRGARTGLPGIAVGVARGRGVVRGVQGGGEGGPRPPSRLKPPQPRAGRLLGHIPRDTPHPPTHPPSHFSLSSIPATHPTPPTAPLPQARSTSR